jgi:hypothetical protein
MIRMIEASEKDFFKAVFNSIVAYEASWLIWRAQ